MLRPTSYSIPLHQKTEYRKVKNKLGHLCYELIDYYWFWLMAGASCDGGVGWGEGRRSWARGWVFIYVTVFH